MQQSENRLTRLGEITRSLKQTGKSEEVGRHAPKPDERLGLVFVSTDADPQEITTDSGRRLKITVGAVIAVGALAVIASAIRASLVPLPPLVGWYDIVIAVVTVTTCARAMLMIRIGSRQHAQSLTDTAIMLGLMLLPGAWMVIAWSMR